MAALTRLQHNLAERIIEMMREDGMGPGARLNESSTAKRLNVSRTPVRAAFQHLADRGIVRRHPNRGVELVLPPVPAGDPAPDAADVVELAMVQLARDRESGVLPDEFSEQEAMRRYRLGRPEIQRFLARLAELDMIERKPGYGWRFRHPARDGSVRDELYRFRILIEPMAMVEPGFRLDAAWIAAMRDRHREALSQPWRESSAIGFFEMNADFHEGLAAASGNRFIYSAVKRQNELRRLSNYDWAFGFERVTVNSLEHLEMLDFLERGEREVASLLMRRHLERASQLRRSDGRD
ncbi:putative HTH-type transcriptional regulator LgoR [Methylobacterium crusticola]|uniref:HTH-type transcriptional regulator LgoR n=1 Tax=Methylobacterium crusticola TaxID=1697972 RepID=A0ABQ4R4B4_9HYPH|nr:GntR family transcriptional regulator [Methylobacterium crusticola]GJD52538.1 putative HTH-type transcriptional regulator LgoR [Methylobacterium crusticola]